MCIPSVWRHGTIVPIPKSETNDPRIPLKYRGISLLSIPYKAFCTMINQCILEWTEDMGILCEEQSEFRSNRSCLEQILALSSVDSMICRITKVVTKFIHLSRGTVHVFFPCQECNSKMEGSLGMRLGFSLIPTHKQGKLGNQTS